METSHLAKGNVLQGIGVSSGQVVGPVLRISGPVTLPTNEPVALDLPAAMAAVQKALDDVAAELERRAQRVLGDAAVVLQATAMMARDPSLLIATRNKLSLIGPASAVDASVREFVAAFISAGGYLAQRATDLLDVRDRAVARLLGLPEPGLPALSSPVIIVATDLAPSETALLDPELVLALVTEEGGETSHTAILAAQLGIPAIVHAAGALEIPDGTVIAVDGTTGEIIIDPDDHVGKQFAYRTGRRDSLLSAHHGPGRLSDGTPISVWANIGTVPDAEHAATCDVEGVGLFRTEFLYGGRQTAPTLEEQIQCYSSVLRAFGERPVTIRTLDAGADKPLPFAHQDPEDNPALGLRGLRMSQRRVDLLTTQLQAISTSARVTGARVRVMAPMVASSAESLWFADQCHAVGLDTVGVMVEVPSAALRARHVLGHVDFASIGTNDLAQYTMAADRMNGELANLLDAWQPAILDLIAATTAGAAGKPVGVCGESAGDPLMALVLVGLGITSLSMAAPKSSAVRLALALHDRASCEKLASAARDCLDPVTARQSVLQEAHPVLRELVELT